MDGALIITFISSLPREVLEAIQGLDTAALQYAEVVRRYQDEGLNEACTAWSNFFKLRANLCPNTQKFTDRFRAALTKLKDLKLVLPEQGVVYQFILAIEESYPDKARDIRRNLRQNKTVTLDSIIHKLNDEARRSDLVKAAAAFASNRNNSGNNGNNVGNNSRSNTFNAAVEEEVVVEAAAVVEATIVVAVAAEILGVTRAQQRRSQRLLYRSRGASTAAAIT
jgi:hypothetical protein